MKPNIFLPVCFILLTSACSVANFKTDVQGNDLLDYRHARITSVQLTSRETSGDAVTSNRRIRLYAFDQLEEALEANGLEVSQAEGIDAALFNMKIDITYGNRVLRFFFPYLLGYGKVEMTLEAVDSESGTTIFTSTGRKIIFTGSAEEAIELNIDVLLEELGR